MLKAKGITLEAMKERDSMDALYELYLVISKSQETLDALAEADKKLFEYQSAKLSESEKPLFSNTVDSFSRLKEEYFFKEGFKAAVNILKQ